MEAQKVLHDFKAVAGAHPFILISTMVLALVFVLLLGGEIAAELWRYNKAVVDDSAALQLREQQAREESVLSTYKLLDADRGVVQIPIERAMELVANERSGRADRLAKGAGR